MEDKEGFYYICNFKELEENKGRRFYVNDTDIAAIKYEGKVYILSNVCPHQLAPSIYEGFVENGCVICPLHGWTFNLSNGRLPNGGRGLESYQVKIENDKIFAKVFPKEINW